MSVPQASRQPISRRAARISALTPLTAARILRIAAFLGSSLLMTFLGLIRRSLSRNKLRTTLTALSITLSIFLVCAVLTLPEMFRIILHHFASSTRVLVHNKAGLAYLLPYGYLAKVRAVPGVEAASSFTWFGGVFDDPKHMFPNFAVDVEAVGDVWPDYGLDPGMLDAFRRSRDGALVGPRLVRRFGWRVGDRFTLHSTVWPVDLDLRIVGVFPEGKDNPEVVWFSRVSLEEALNAKGLSANVVPMIWARVGKPSEILPAMGRIDTLFRNSDHETETETEKSFVLNFMGSLEGMTRLITAVGFLVVVAVVFIAANSCSMSIRERSRETAVLKAIGFQRNLLLRLFLAEALSLSVAGGFTGAVGAYGFFKLLGWMGATGITPALGPLSLFVMTISVLVQGLFLSILVGMLAGIVPSWSAARRPVAASLHDVF